MWSPQTLGYHSAIKRDVLLIHVTTCINHRNILGEGSQSQKAAYCMILFIGNTKVARSIEMENRLVAA